MKKKHALERLVTYELGPAMIEHIHRYGIAAELCKNKVVLDIASGEGYGTNFLAVTATSVVGVDISPDAVKEANEKYATKRSNLDFIEGSADKIPAKTGQFDVVISFETIEHHDKHEEMIAEIKRVLKPGGLLVISSPDKFFYSEKPGTQNPFHVKELYKEEFRALLTNSFKNVDLYRQKSFYSSVIVPDDDKPVVRNTKFYEGNYTGVTVNNDIESVYLVALASDAALENLDISVFRDYDFVDNMRKKWETQTRYQFGNMVLNPVKFFKEKIKSRKDKNR